MFAGIFLFVMSGRMHFQVYLTHKPPVAVLGHAFMSLDASVDNLMLIELTLKAEFLPAGFTDVLSIFLMFIEMELKH